MSIDTQKIRVGLHAQTLNNKAGAISGSEITTKGLKNAFLQTDLVFEVVRFGPEDYELIKYVNFDLFIIEGWHKNVPHFIDEARKYNPSAIILFWNLSFFGFEHVIHLQVDGYLCNSQKNTVILSKIKPTCFLMLAADPDEMTIKEPSENLKADVAYLGMFHPAKSETVFNLIVNEAIDYDLTIYGINWQKHTTLINYWKGVLPIHQISDLYNSVSVVLGTTEDRQRKVGMINNRVFEVLACGGSFVCEYFPELEKEFGDLIYYSRNFGDTKRHISTILSLNDEENQSLKIKRREFILANHTYKQRVNQIIDFYYSIKNKNEQHK